MSRPTLRAVRAVLVIGVIAAIAGAASPAGSAKGISYHSLNKIQKRLISGSLAMSLVGAPTSKAAQQAGTAACGNGQNGGDEPDEAPSCPPDSYTPAPGPGGPGGGGADQNYTPSGNNGCALNRGNNVKVNQECLTVSDPDLQGRGQAQNEESIAVDPNNPDHVVASQNDYRRGDGNCYAAYSLNGGKDWNDSTVPMSFTRGDGSPREYWQAGGDTSLGWDTRGNAYISCQVFNRGAGASPNPDESSAFVVMRSTQNDGASWNFPGRYTTVNFDPSGTTGVLEDKALMAIDDNKSSPFRDRIYVTWTAFAADGTAYLYETHSDDYGETFSSPVLVSTNSAALCDQTYGLPTPNGNCNENQDSDPFVGPDGSLYVAYNNYNTAVSGNENFNRVLLVKSTDGGNTFSAPVLVSNYYDLPDCDTYQGAGADSFRECVPEKGSSTVSVFRADNYPSGAVNPKQPNQVAVTFGSYINKHSNESNGCIPAGFSSTTGINLYTGVKTPGACNNDILVSVSNNGGASFTGTTTDPRDETTVNQDPGQATTDQWFQWASFTKDGKLAVDYYDRQYGNDETTGSSDFTLSGSKDLVKFGSKRVTSSSMPPPTQFGGPKGGQFYGDYIWLDTAGNDALPIWSDTRDPELFLCPGTGTPGNPPGLCTATENTGVQANDENSYMARMPVPTK